MITKWFRQFTAPREHSRQEMVRFLVDCIPWVLIAFFSLAYIRLALHNHFIFRTGEDLAHYGQALWHLSYGRLPYSSFKGFVLWGDHGHFIIALLAPLYRLLPDVRFLLYVQALAVTLSGFAVYRVAADKLQSKFFGNAALFSYLSFVGIQYALNFDFHPSVLTGAVICWLIYGLYFKNYWVYWLALALGLLTREDAGPIFFLIGIYEIVIRRWRIGLLTATISAAAFLLIAYHIMPLWTPDGVPLLYLNDDNKSFTHIVISILKYPKVYLENMFDTAVKRSTINTLFASFAYLPLLSPFTYITSASIFFSRFVNTDDYRWAIDNHSNANILPLLVFGAIFAAATVRRGVARLSSQATYHTAVSTVLGLVLIASTILTSWTSTKIPLPGLMQPNQPKTPIPAARATSFTRGVEQFIGPDDKVSASSGMTGHLSHRWEIYNFPYGLDKADVVIISLRINTWPLKRDEMNAELKKLRADEAWEQVWNQDEIIIFRRK